MPNLVVSNFAGAPTINKNCGWGIAVNCVNVDGSAFDLTPFTSFTFQVRDTPAYDARPLASGGVAVVSSVGGVLTLGLSALATKTFPAKDTSFGDLTPVWGELNGILTADPLNPVCLGKGVLQVAPGGNAEQTTGTAPTVPLQTINLIVGAVSAAAARALIGLSLPLPGTAVALATSSTSGAVPFLPINQRTATAGSGGVLANRIVYNTAGTVLHARANALSTAQGLAGVTLAAASAAASAQLVTSVSSVRIKADTVCVPVIDSQAFLSDQSGGLVASSINGSMYPRCIGYFNEASVGGDGCVEVRLLIDSVRDANMLWKLEMWAPTVDSQLYDFTINPALWESLEIRVLNENSNLDTGDYVYLRTDGVACAAVALEVVVTSAAGSYPRPLLNFGANKGNGRSRINCDSPYWTIHSVMCQDLGRSCISASVFTPPTTSIGLIGRLGNAFAANVGSAELWGKSK